MRKFFDKLPASGFSGGGFCSFGAIPSPWEKVFAALIMNNFPISFKNNL